MLGVGYGGSFHLWCKNIDECVNSGGDDGKSYSYVLHLKMDKMNNHNDNNNDNNESNNDDHDSNYCI